jgi:hypothetical protein
MFLIGRTPIVNKSQKSRKSYLAGLCFTAWRKDVLASICEYLTGKSDERQVVVCLIEETRDRREVADVRNG